MGRESFGAFSTDDSWDISFAVLSILIPSIFVFLVPARSTEDSDKPSSKRGRITLTGAWAGAAITVIIASVTPVPGGFAMACISLGMFVGGVAEAIRHRSRKDWVQALTFTLAPFAFFSVGAQMIFSTTFRLSMDSGSLWLRANGRTTKLDLSKLTISKFGDDYVISDGLAPDIYLSERTLCLDSNYHRVSKQALATTVAAWAGKTVEMLTT